MNVLGVVVIWALSAVLVAWVFDLVRRDRLYVGYDVIFVGAVTAGLALISLPRVLGTLSRLWIRVEPASGFYDLVLLFMLVLLKGSAAAQRIRYSLFEMGPSRPMRRLRR